MQHAAHHRTHRRRQDGGGLRLRSGAGLQGRAVRVATPFGVVSGTLTLTLLDPQVFEVNASSQRSGRLILSQLREATQSHQVDSQGVNAHKPSFFNNYSSSGGSGSLKQGLSPSKITRYHYLEGETKPQLWKLNCGYIVYLLGKINSPRRVVSSPRKLPQSPRGAKRGGLAPSSLAKFFKMSQPSTKETAKNQQTGDCTCTYTSLLPFASTST